MLETIWIWIVKHFGIIPEGMTVEEYHEKIEKEYSFKNTFSQE
jgi:hypothetical protein